MCKILRIRLVDVQDGPNSSVEQFKRLDEGRHVELAIAIVKSIKLTTGEILGLYEERINDLAAHINNVGLFVL